jgi:hypothetical protein
MMAKNDNRNAQIVDIYSESVHFDTCPRPLGLTWIKSLHSKRARLATNESINLVRKDVRKTKPFQIRKGIEDLDQNNRHIKIGMNFVRQVNKNLKFELEQEVARFDSLKTIIENSKPIVTEIKRNESTTASHLFDQIAGRDEIGSSHLNKNLELQIHLTNGEIRKFEQQVEALKSSAEFYGLIELVAIRKVYIDDFERLCGYKERLNNAQNVVSNEMKSKKRTKLILIKKKIQQTETKLKQIEEDTEKSENFITEIRQKTKRLMLEEKEGLIFNEELRCKTQTADTEIAHYKSLLKELTH